MFKKIHVGALALAGAAVLSATPLGAQEITVTAWGGAYTKSQEEAYYKPCLLYTSPSPRDRTRSRMPSSA